MKKKVPRPGTIWIDITDVINWRGAVTGIQRVNLMYAFWGATTGKSRTFSFDSNLRVFQTYSFIALFILRHKLRGVHLAVAAWFLYRTVKRGERIFLFFLGKMGRISGEPFGGGDRIIFAGVYWQEGWLQSLVDTVTPNTNLGLEFIVCDMIPFLKPEFMPKQILDPFQKATVLALEIANQVFAISKNTARDIETVCQKKGIQLPSLTVIRLGDDLGQWFGSSSVPNLQSDHFILAVGTVEVRKNYLRLIQAWKRLVNAGGNRGLKLVICGRPGWCASEEIHILETQAIDLQIVWLRSSTDSELNWLYENCLFSVYPSLYEGWGLPVAEALFHGKRVLASNSSSIPEVSDVGIRFFDPSSVSEIYSALEAELSKERSVSIPNIGVSWESSFQELVSTGQKCLGSLNEG